MKGMDLSVVPYEQDSKSEGEANDVVRRKPVDDSREPPAEPVVMNPKPTSKIKYKECLRNHAASIGGHANDGCGEFFPSTAGDNLTCAACGCHRNFHRKEVQGTGCAEHHHSLQYSSPPPPMLLCNSGSSKRMGGFNAVHSRRGNGGGLFGDSDHQNEIDVDYDRRSETPERGGVQVGTTIMTTVKNKRFRTKFTQEQKEKMMEFAEKLGWRIQKQNDVLLNQFCSEVGIKRNVLKVWMHNNKNAHRRQEPAPPTSIIQLPPPAQVGV